MMTRTRATLGLLAACAALAGCAGGDGGNGGGACDLLTGDLVISEVMANPMGPDDGQEYFEIYNASSAAVDMSGVTLRYAKSDGTGEKTHVMDEIVIDAGDYLVVGDVVQELKPNHVDYGYGNALGSMLNAGARLSILCGDEVIDETDYPDMEGDEGVSFGLDGNVAPDHLLNDDVENFCPATSEFSTGLFGSPGESNEPCNIVVPGQCNDGGTMRDTVPPEAGDLVITEFLANPADADGAGEAEWFEVYVGAAVDLNGVVAGLVPGAPKLSIDSSECVAASAGTYLLFAGSADANGGLPPPDFVFNFGPLKQGTTTTGDGSLFVGIGDVTLDQITYATTTDGAATALDPALLDPAANDDAASWCIAEEPYGDAGNLGTPGAENVCPVACEGGQCFDGEECRDPIAPGAGDLLVVEVMANPILGGTDTAHEWIELRATDEFDLNGVELTLDGTIVQTLADDACMSVTADQLVLLAKTNDPLLNGELPEVDYLKTFNLPNDNSTVGVGVSGTELDSLDYQGLAGNAGTSTQADTDGTVCLTPETTPYNADGDLGTPGDANPDCP